MGMGRRRVPAEVRPRSPFFRGPQGTELVFEAEESFLLVKHPELGVGILGAVVGPALVEANLSGEAAGIEQPDGVYFTSHEAGPTGCV